MEENKNSKPNDKSSMLNERDRLYYEKLSVYKKDSDQEASAAAARRNTALITISGGGLYVILEEMRHIQSEGLVINTWIEVLIGIAGFSFVTALISNFFMYFRSYKAHRRSSDSTEYEMSSLFEELTDIAKIAKADVDCKAKDLDRQIRDLKIVDTTSMLIGIALLTFCSAVVFYIN